MRALPAEARGVVRAWLLLGIGALALATAIALVLAASRAPILGERLPVAGWFRTALVLHVVLAVGVWFLSVAAAHWSALAPATRAAWLPFGAAVAGVCAMLAAPSLEPAEPVLNNYLPVLNSPTFLGGLAAFGAGVLAAYLMALAHARPAPAGEHGTDDAVPALLSGVPLLMAIVSLAWSAVALPSSLAAPAYFETLFWGAGHALVHGYVCLMMLAWLALAAARGVRVAPWLVALGFVAQVVPTLAVPLIHAVYPPQSAGFRAAFTALMSWGAWPGALVLGAAIVRSCRRARGADRAAGIALYASMALFALGLALGATIRHDTAIVPAHYHATVGAVTAALMAWSLRLLAAPPAAQGGARGAGLQTALYVGGLAIVALSLAWAGSQGVARKAPIATHVLELPAQAAAMSCMALGALTAVAGAMLFFAAVARAVLPRARARLASIQDRGGVAGGVTAGLVTLGGLALSLWPGPQGVPSPDPQARSEADAQLRREFDEAVRLLREGRHKQAAIALHGVLVRAPTLPEAHANMGYALLGLGRNQEARGFFESASELRPAQANAYYGLAVALERLHDLPGAVGAMRTYVHLTHAADPHLRKARAALWEWEAQLALLRTGQADPQEAQP